MTKEDPSGLRLPGLPNIARLLCDQISGWHDATRKLVSDLGALIGVGHNLDGIGVDQILNFKQLGLIEHLFLMLWNLLLIELFAALLSQVSDRLGELLKHIEAVILCQLVKEVQVADVCHDRVVGLVAPLGVVIGMPHRKELASCCSSWVARWTFKSSFHAFVDEACIFSRRKRKFWSL